MGTVARSTAVEGRIPIFVDSGFRSGLDVTKALALGAHAVFLGRSLLRGLPNGGEGGANRVDALNRRCLQRAEDYWRNAGLLRQMNEKEMI